MRTYLPLRHFFILSVLVLLAKTGVAQVGGLGVYQSLMLPPSARVAALGGYQIAVLDDALPLGFQNPALLNDNMHQQAAFQHVNYLADINFGFAGYGHSIDSQLTVMGGIQYLSFGEFTRTDPLGNPSGQFTGGDYALSAGIGYKWRDNWRFGANLKLIYSHLEQYYSWGVATDLAAVYNSDDEYFTAALVVRNLGTQLIAYHQTREPLPLDVQVAFSQRLANAPFRFNVTAHHLNIPNMTYTNPNAAGQVIQFGDDDENEEDERLPIGDIIARHFVVGVELLLTENLHFRVGYNHQRRREMLLPTSNQFANNKGGVGYSWGFGLRIWRFHIDYGRASYHLAGASNHFSLTSNISSWYKKEPAKKIGNY